MNNLQKWGGIAALGHAAAYLVGLALGLILDVSAPERRARAVPEVSGG